MFAVQEDQPGTVSVFFCSRDECFGDSNKTTDDVNVVVSGGARAEIRLD